ncbi:hypothetical protein JMN32_05045 [Fulvivirga sp. 29W222]|uniref:Uncharacterized protein n=1 Tax=Fulvivirga marina TaxID=2494733 RepID=A0A937FVC3_9BACT|nr:hypothetical protein [Fulvivirga marina]MBL6445663.1 hypothetical protein [Fulvivirga marina]
MIYKEKELTSFEMNVLKLHVYHGYNKIKALLEVFSKYTSLKNSELDIVNSGFWARPSVQRQLRKMQGDNDAASLCEPAIGTLYNHSEGIEMILL